MKFSFVLNSGNAKTGPIPVTMSDRNSCPDNCKLKGNGCYAELGHVRYRWDMLAKPENKKALSIDQLCGFIKALPKGQLWRHNVAGDLPHTEGLINENMVDSLIAANKWKKGFTYTHHNVNISHNYHIIKKANKKGFTINLSADTLQDADSLYELNIGPVVCILPMDADKITYTPKGKMVIKCPATYQENVTCSNCGICAVSNRKAIIGFPVHGVRKKAAQRVFMMQQG